MMLAHRLPDRHRSERGQMVVLFGFLLVAIVLMVGIVLDGGSATAQRRSQQNAADLAAIAGADTYMVTNDQAAARTSAIAVAAQNGWTTGGPNPTATAINVTFDTQHGYKVTVGVAAKHHNDFGAVVGMTTWDVATTATALSGFPDSAAGAAPFIFSIEAFNGSGEPLPPYNGGNSAPKTPFGFGGCGDTPAGPGEFAWTNYGTGNVNTSEVRNIIDGDLVINKTLAFGEYIGQHNQGCHTALYGPVDDELSGTDVAVPIVDDNGNFQGWATFHVTSASGGSTKKIFGYFVSSFVNEQLSVTTCSPTDCPRYLGSYVLKLVN